MIKGRLNPVCPEGFVLGGRVCRPHRQERTTYALEGSVACAGRVVQWLRDNMGVISSSKDFGRRSAVFSSASQR